MWRGITQGSVQTEGAAMTADWWDWEQQGRAPRSGDGNGFGNGFADDLALFASLGHTHVRLTVEWARIEPVAGKLDSDQIDRYRDILSAARHVGLDPIVTLVSSSLPGWFLDNERGFLDEHSRRSWWISHVERCAHSFEGLAAGWVGIEDPVGWAVRSHLLATRPPGLIDPIKTIDAVAAALEADRLAATILRAGEAPVMSSFGLPTIHPVGEGAGSIARWWDDLLWESWIGAVSGGELTVPGLPLREAPEWVDLYDIIGFTHSHPIGVDVEGRLCPYPIHGNTDDTGFSPTPAELGEAMRRLADELPGHDLLITGTGVSTADDDYRDTVLAETARQVDGAAADGVPVLGWLHDTGVDGYEWNKGFGTQRGIIDGDRNVKPSATRLTPPSPNTNSAG